MPVLGPSAGLAPLQVTAHGRVFGTHKVNLLVAALVLVDATVLRARRGHGIATGLVTGVKLTPALFVFLLAATRQWRATATAGASFLATVPMGALLAPRQPWWYWTTGLLRIGRGGISAGQLVPGRIGRPRTGPSRSQPVPPAKHSPTCRPTVKQITTRPGGVCSRSSSSGDGLGMPRRAAASVCDGWGGGWWRSDDVGRA